MLRLAFACAFLAAMLAFSSSLSPLYVVFGASWQIAAMVSGWIMLGVLLTVGLRADRRR